MTDISILIAIAVGAGLIQGITGFGSGLFSMGLLALIMPIPQATVIVSIISLTGSALNLWSVRHDLVWADAKPLLLISLPASVLGVYLLTRLDPSILRTGIAVMIIIGCVVTLWSPKTRIRKPFPWAYITGFIGGIFSGALNMSGPPIVFYTLLRGWNKTQSKGLMSIYFLASTLLRLTLLIAMGIATGEIIQKGLIVTIPALLGTYAGTHIFRRMSNQRFRYAATVLLMGLAAKILLT